MKWLNTLSRRPDASPTEPQKPVIEEHRSLALESLGKRLASFRSLRVLDLGKASSSNLDFFVQFSRKIHIEDLYRTISGFDYLSPEDGVPLEKVFRYLLPFRSGTRFDLVFSWDLFNYLNREELISLSRHISRHGRSGTVLFSMISSRPLIPERPLDYSILDGETILYSCDSHIMRKCPQYQETDLGRFLPDFRVGSSYLLRNGIKEYLFVQK